METPNATHLLQWFLILGLITSIGANLVLIFGRFGTQKREVTFGDDYIKRAECKLSHQAIEDRLVKCETSQTCLAAKVGADYQRIEEAGEARARRLHARIDDLQAEMRGIPKQVIDTINAASAIKSK